MSDDFVPEDRVLSDAELAEYLEAAKQIQDNPPAEYSYRGEYRGGPRRVDPDDLTASAADLVAARMIWEELKARTDAAYLQLLECVEEQADAGIPIEHIAQYAGIGHRPNVYRELKRLPELREKLARP